MEIESMGLKSRPDSNLCFAVDVDGFRSVTGVPRDMPRPETRSRLTFFTFRVDNWRQATIVHSAVVGRVASDTLLQTVHNVAVDVEVTKVFELFIQLRIFYSVWYCR
jgi:hypothetical protein